MTSRILAVLLAASAIAPRARAEDAAPPCHGAPEAPPAARTATDTRVEVPDVELVDQDGRKVRVRELLSGNRAVVADFVFTTCTTVCPMLSSILSRMQDGVGDRLGKEVLFVSISVDPDRDTPAKLQAYARRWKARPGWVWLTGPRDRVEQVLKGMGAYTPRFADHSPMILVGDARSGAWTRFNGFPDRQLLLARVDEIVSARGGGPVARARED
jgi:cytochrome oxidase Cu insertion factor (SCO1/SenC/PrrC family)